MFCTLKSLLHNEFCTNLRHNLPSICEIEIHRKNINPSFSKPEIVEYFYLLMNCVNVSFITFIIFSWCTFVTF